MPRYFFDLYEGPKFSPDEDGTDCASLEDAIVGAKRLLPELASAADVAHQDECHLDVIVRNEAGEAVFTANCHDSRMLAATLDAVPSVRTGRRGRPRRRPHKLHADKAYDHRRCRRECRARNISPRITRRGVESSERLGRYRWIVERTLAWLARFCRLAIRYEPRADLRLAFTTLACALICQTQAKRFCP